MISLISVGVSNYITSSVCHIPCAGQDSQNLYQTFEKVFRQDFSQYNSICLNSPTSSEFKLLLSTITSSYGEQDLLVLHFSGHGVVEGDKLFLCFRDNTDEGKGQGRVSNRELGELLWYFKCKVLVILDCCSSGAAIDIANKVGLLDNHKISVITSNSHYSPAEFDDKGSAFNKIVCQALLYLFENEEEISVVRLVDQIKKFGGNDCLVNLNEESGNLILSAKLDNEVAEKEFTKRFLNKLKDLDYNNREMLWYSLSDFPAKLKLSILGEYFDGLFSEPSWLVRRAIGSMICQINGDEDSKKALQMNLLTSHDWMRQCIGLIGARYDVETIEIANAMKSILLDNRTSIGAIWLANLYLSDSSLYQVEFGLKSKLIKTTWGVIDLWERSYKKNMGSLLKLFEKNIEGELLKPLYDHLLYKYPEDLDIAEKCLEHSSSEFVAFLYKKSKRGRLDAKKQNNKWLYSMIYGSWRDQIVTDLGAFIDNYGEDVMRKYFADLSNAPLVEMKMAVFQYMVIYQEQFERYRDFLTWGLVDPHPWVRREALETFKDFPLLYEQAFETILNKDIYPGVLDFIILAGEVGYSGYVNYVAKYNLTRTEKKALNLCEF